MNPKAIEEAMKKMPPSRSTRQRAAVEPRRAAVEAAPDADPPSADRRPTKRPSAGRTRMLRFTVRNEVLHGPVLGLSGFGIARVDSHLVLEREDPQEDRRRSSGRRTRSKSARASDSSAVARPRSSPKAARSSRRTTSRRSPGRPSSSPSAIRAISTTTTSMASGRSSRSTTTDDKTQFVMTDMTHGRRRQARPRRSVRRRLQLRDRRRSPSSATARTRSKSANLHYIVRQRRPRTTSLAWAPRWAPARSRASSSPRIGIEIKEVHYDFSVRRLHAETLEKMIADIKATYAKPLTNALEAERSHVRAPQGTRHGAAQVRPGVRHRPHRPRDARRRWLSSRA